MKIKLEKEEIKTLEEVIWEEISSSFCNFFDDWEILYKVQVAMEKEFANWLWEQIAKEVKKYLNDNMQNIIEKKVQEAILKIN